MPVFPSIFALLCAAAGWYYLLHAQSAARLSAYESERENRVRVRLRRAGGVGILVMSLAFFLCFISVNRRVSPYLTLAGLTIIALMLPTILFLAWVDMRLTRRLKERQRDRDR